MRRDTLLAQLVSGDLSATEGRHFAAEYFDLISNELDDMFILVVKIVKSTVVFDAQA